LELIGILGDLKEVDKFLFEEIYSTLTESEKKVLQLASVMRYPAPSEVLLNAGSNEIIDILVRKALLREVGDGFEIQDILREFFKNKTPPALRREMHTFAKGYYSVRSDTQSLLESAYHTFYSGQKTEAIAFLVFQVNTFVREGLFEDLISLIDGFGAEIPKELYKQAFGLRGKVANVWGTWDNNLESVFEARLLFNLLGFEVKQPTMEMRTSFLGSSAEDTEDTLRDLKGSIAILEKVGDVHGIAHTKYSMAWVRWIRGEMSLARKEAVRLLEMAPDDELRARAMLLLGGTALEDGAYAQSSDWFSKAEKVFNKLGVPEGQVLAASLRSGADLLAAYMVMLSGQRSKRKAKGSRNAFSSLDSYLEKTIMMARDNHLPRGRTYAELRRSQVLLVSLIAGAHGVEEPKTGEGASGAFEALSGKALDLTNTFKSLRDAFGATLAKTVAGLALSNVDKDIPRAIELLKTASDELGRSSLDILSGVVLLHLEKVYSRSGDTFGAMSSRKAAEALGVVPRRR
jgi:tetratricopeptide (TPR) repeat protein